MNFSFFYPRSTHRSEGLHNLSCSCQHGPYQVWSSKRLLLSKIFCQDWHSRILPIIVFFYNVYFKTFNICLRCILSRVQSGHSREGSAPFLRVLLIFNLSDVFRKRLQSCRENFWSCFRILTKGATEMSENLLTVSARAGLTCQFKSNQGDSALVVKLSVHMTPCLAVFFLGDLACTSVTCDSRYSKTSGVNALLLPRTSLAVVDQYIW